MSQKIINYTKPNHVVSFSGGRTSAYLVYLMERKHRAENINVEYIFLDTGAEHPKTYKFIRNIAKHWNINITRLRVKTNPKLGKGNTYQVISIDDIKPWHEMLQKYSTPHIGTAFCTDRLKTTPFKKYCDEKYGKNNYTTWLGIRADEPRRLKNKHGFKYLADLSEMGKEDILTWWTDQAFDLGIPEYLGNCVFCVKKSTAKIAAAMKHEPKLAQAFKNLLHHPDIRKA